MNNLIPSFEWHRVIVQPWAVDFSITLWIVLMGFLSLRRAAWSAISSFCAAWRWSATPSGHSILPGLVVVHNF